MSVSGTPERPKPPHRSVLSDCMSAIAAEAEGKTLLISWRRREEEKPRARLRWVWGGQSKPWSDLVCVGTFVVLREKVRTVRAVWASDGMVKTSNCSQGLDLTSAVGGSPSVTRLPERQQPQKLKVRHGCGFRHVDRGFYRLQTRQMRHPSGLWGSGDTAKADWMARSDVVPVTWAVSSSTPCLHPHCGAQTRLSIGFTTYVLLRGRRRSNIGPVWSPRHPFDGQLNRHYLSQNTPAHTLIKPEIHQA